MRMVSAIIPTTFEGSIEFLIAQDAPPHLIRHSRIVGGVAADLSRSISAVGVLHDAMQVTVGAVLHDAGKILCPAELTGPGKRHEAAGLELLLSLGVPASIANICVTHGTWTADLPIEHLMVAAADHLWCGKRTVDLEELLIRKCARTANVEVWKMMLKIDPILETIAAVGEKRLAHARSQAEHKLVITRQPATGSQSETEGLTPPTS